MSAPSRKSLFPDVNALLETRRQERGLRRILEWSATMPIERDAQGRVSLIAMGWYHGEVCQFWWIEPLAVAP